MKSNRLFDLTAEYDAMLERGIRLSGEQKHFFVRGRLRDLHEHLPSGLSVRRVLDFGCGLGDTTQALAEEFPGARVVGADTSEPALAHARERCGNGRVDFALVDDLPLARGFDLCYCNGVFHHIELADRRGALDRILASLTPAGMFALYENNPWNLGTRWVMHRIPFDKDARPLSSVSAGRLLASAGFRRLVPARFLFFFPRYLRFLRCCEPCLARVPLGAQYCVSGIK